MTSFFDKLNLRPGEPRLLVLVGLAGFVVLNVIFVWPRFGELGDQLEARRDALARQAVDEVDARRLSYIAQCFSALGFPIGEARAGIERIAAAYAAVGATDNFTAHIEPGSGHTLSEEMWCRAREKFARHL